MAGKRNGRKPHSEFWSWITQVVLPVAIVLLLNLFVCKLAVVNGDSMYPTLHERDLLLVLMPNYEPQRGDIVVINTPEEGRMHGDKIVKRIIALGGETVEIDYDANRVLINGEALDEPYINYAEADPMEAFFSGEAVVVPEGFVYVLGDNRNHSGDSRDPTIGLIAETNILGVKIAHVPFGEWLGKKG